MKNNIIVILIGIVLMGFVSCTKMDDFKKYVEGGEISYTGRVDSLKVYSGRNRVLINGLFISDRKITKCKIYWNSRQDSVEIPVVRKLAVDTLRQYINNLREGNYTFEIVTYDALNNPSIPVEKSGVKVYGSNYEQSLNNMPISDVSLDNTVTTITWGGLDKSSGAQYVDIIYKDVQDVLRRVNKPTALAKAVLPEYKYRSTFDYRTVYLPEPTAIDTFYTTYTRGISARTDVTASFIDNPGKMDPRSTTGTPFQPISYTEGAVVAGNAATWRRLAAWTTNAQANNWGTGFDTYGTWVARTAETVANFGTLSLEAGRNTTLTALNTINNGKIYQTKLLPAGEYSLEARVGNASSNTKIYFVANAGNVIPDIEVLTQRPSIVNFSGLSTDASYMQITTQAQGYTISINFTLHSPTTVSFGFVGSLVGTSTTNQYLKISGVRMKSLEF